MSISRHFEIVYLLLHKKTLTASELAERFEVSTRTIYRDIDILSEAGIPIFSSRGKGGGISLMEGFVFNASLLSEREQDDILMGLQSLTAARFPEIEEVLGKLSRLFKKDGNGWIEVDFSPWGSEERERRLFPLLRKAIATNRVITFRYYNTFGNQSNRSVEPATLLFKSKAWYLMGYCLTSNGNRTFKISRMKDIVATDTKFESRQAISFSEAEDNVMVESLDVTLTITAAGAYRVYDEFDEKTITLNPDGSYVVKAKFPEGAWLESYLLSFGTLLVNVEPEHLRAKILTNIDAIRRKLEQRSD
ncbi:helix-turn-helix transcriptional regulator [Cohnella lupini]|uniref:Putative DNA-binding transcriptional regulator YafY n=1 Tax=Cohnella lupini TaxID=1294267 RepID=A0A3D9IDK7_9BACL|nr:YafY family protein [Cohnella lupini]RED59296.1 putative DNA-binding transcriptional regulator YafY [Cohnella lupini]